MSRSLLEIAESEYFVLNLKIRSQHTIYQYLIALRCFSRSLGRDATIDDLNDDAITRWMGQLLRQVNPDTGLPLSVNTVRERCNRVLALWAWLAKRTVGMRWPTVVKPRAKQSLPTALSEDQLRRLFHSASKERGVIERVPAELWWVSYLAFVWNTAERKSAALAVKVSWLDLERGIATIPPEIRKGGDKWGCYQLWPESLPLLKACLAADPNRDLMWPWGKCKQSYYTAYDRILRDAGIPVDRRHKTHSLRVSHATWLKAIGGDPTRQLMHGSQETTTRHYIDPRMMPPDPHRLFIPWSPPPGAG